MKKHPSFIFPAFISSAIPAMAWYIDHPDEPFLENKVHMVAYFLYAFSMTVVSFINMYLFDSMVLYFLQKREIKLAILLNVEQTSHLFHDEMKTLSGNFIIPKICWSKPGNLLSTF
jgi:hypothetical protein